MFPYLFLPIGVRRCFFFFLKSLFFHTFRLIIHWPEWNAEAHTLCMLMCRGTGTPTRQHWENKKGGFAATFLHHPSPGLHFTILKMWGRAKMWWEWKKKKKRTLPADSELGSRRDKQRIVLFIYFLSYGENLWDAAGWTESETRKWDKGEDSETETQRESERERETGPGQVDSARPRFGNPMERLASRQHLAWIIESLEKTGAPEPLSCVNVALRILSAACADCPQCAQCMH